MMTTKNIAFIRCIKSHELVKNLVIQKGTYVGNGGRIGASWGNAQAFTAAKVEGCFNDPDFGYDPEYWEIVYVTIEEPK